MFDCHVNIWALDSRKLLIGSSGNVTDLTIDKIWFCQCYTHVHQYDIKEPKASRSISIRSQLKSEVYINVY